MLNSGTQKETKNCFDEIYEQIQKKRFTAFLKVHSKEITSVIKNTKTLKGPRHILDKVLHSDNFDQYLKYSVCEKGDEILK